MDRRILKSNLKGERKHNKVTFNPTSAKMSEKIYATIPRLDPSLSILPGTTNLIYNFKNSNVKSWPLNNLNRLFVNGLQVKIGKDIIYDNTGESVYRLYEDLWLPSEDRSKMTRYGIGSEEMRKSLAKSDDASSSSTTNGLKDKTTAELMENQRIRLGQIMDDHGLHSPNGMNFETKYTITLPPNSLDIGQKQSGQSVGDFSLENLQLEYDTIQNQNLAERIEEDYSRGKNLVFHHISLESITEWDKDATLINENLHLNRESMKAIVFLFKWTEQKLDENFIYPNITEVSCNVNGKPNVVHINSMKPDDMELEANRFFGGNEISTGKFFTSAFSLVLDFRSESDSDKYNDGIKVSGASGIQVTFKRTASTKNVRCYTFVISDSIHQIDNKGFQKTII